MDCARPWRPRDASLATRDASGWKTAEPNPIFEAFDRCTRRFQLWVSSPGAPRGQFFDSFNRDRKFFWTRRVPSTECPHISEEKRARDLEKYGIHHPLYRSMHLAEFTEDVGRLVLTSERLTTAIECQPKIAPGGETVAFCDFAAGGDENVLAIRRGNHAKIAKAWVEANTMQAAREFVYLFKANGLHPGEVWGDADGLGTVMIDAIEELGFYMNRFHGGQAASDPDEYANLIGEIWHVGAREIERGRVAITEVDERTGIDGALSPITFEQLTTRKSEWSDNGKLRVESKEKMRKEGIRSPDRADALLGCIGCGARLSGAVTYEAAKASAVGESEFASEIVTGF